MAGRPLQSGEEEAGARKPAAEKPQTGRALGDHATCRALVSSYIFVLCVAGLKVH